jgi:2,4-dienoyl-CoA reductase-like NADH-dependent reductase (Old Yellow Enzyme family)
MGILFEPTKIKTMVIRNRFVRSATVDNSAESGYVSEKQIKLFTDLAQGGVGLIVTGMTCVHASDHIRPSQNSLASDQYLPGYKKLTASVHNWGAKIAVQLAHAGRERGKFIKDKKDQAIAPSFIEHDPYCETKNYRPMTQKEIWEIIDAFGDAAKRAREAGFDAVELHGAHAFLLSQFLSPYTNRRDDEWGGPLENRLRIHYEIYKTIRKKVGKDFPVLIKLGVQDGFSGGLEFEEGRKAAQLLAQLGFDAMEISQGLRGEWFEGTEFRTKIDRPDREAYFREWCKNIKHQVNVPVMMVGGLRTFELMEEIIQNGEADYISLCRPFIREPDVIKHWKSGNHRKAQCISCNKCIEALKNGESLYCPQKKIEKNN